ncbi:class I SAM-dependent methyltransferase [uncultured Cocleimonas sp.]|uniref:class I SAM-dependent methyltransferase n=1 Tax=uncultured Cocleimonas sp. TaxID=1051587 RepID=UPI002631A8E7|nr:class I SAM-dependent methyltransferase [uncultured Cocleimonas sp.]
MTKNTRAKIDFSLSWVSASAEHCDVFHAEDIDLEKDVFPTGFSENLAELAVGESYTETFPANALLRMSFDPAKVKTFAAKDFDKGFRGQNIIPMLYRYFPSAVASKGLGTDPRDFKPFRIMSMEGDNMTGDCNHPLAKYFLTLSATIIEWLEPKNTEDQEETRKKHIGQIVANRGPGMQVPFEFGRASYFSDYPFKREDEAEDATFYKEPRMVHHLDATATSEITQLYSKLLDKNAKVLDLMSSWNSHLSDDLSLSHVTGLGMNQQELEANKQLNDFTVQDLNLHQILPYADDHFDAAICTASIEYLTYPLKIMTEAARVIKPGGKFVVTFSERWFPTKAITLWSQLHPFERMQLVLEYFSDSGLFSELNTYSKRGLPRPEDDQYFEEIKTSDPVYAIWGTVKK